MRMGIRRRGWWELALFSVTSAVIVIIVFTQTKNMAWRVLAFPLGILFALCIAYLVPNLVIKIKKKKRNKKIQNLVWARLHP